MLTNEERIKEMHQRAGKIAREERRRKVVAIQSVSAVLSFAAVIVFALLMPKATGNMPEIIHDSLNASIFSTSSMLGFIMIGIIAFLLGVTVTVLCFRLRKWEEEKDKEDIYD